MCSPSPRQLSPTVCTGLALLVASLFVPRAGAGPAAGRRTRPPLRRQAVSELLVTPSLTTHRAPAIGELARTRDGLRQAGLHGLDRFVARATADWEVRWDLRSDRPHLIQGVGYPLLPGAGNHLTGAGAGLAGDAPLGIDEVAAVLRRFIDEQKELLGIDSASLQLDRDTSTQLPGGQVWLVTFQQVHQGVPVVGANVFFRVNAGNVIQFGTDRVADVGVSVVPRLSREKAFAGLLDSLSLSAADVSETLEAGRLALHPTLRSGEAPASRYAGRPGQGYAHVLAWEFRFRRSGDIATYGALVDAQDGRVLRLQDENRSVDATVHGGIYPRTMADAEEDRPFPFASLTNGAPKVTDANGVYDYTGGVATTALDGRYATVNDFCGAVSLSDDSTGDLDLGASGGTNCETPGRGGAGNTHAARNAFYHMTKVNRKAATYLPGNAWLEGQPIIAATNLPGLFPCNAFSFGSPGVLLPAGEAGCANTAEIADIVYHEWGHSLDDAIGGWADFGTGEALGDTVAFLETHDACIAPGLGLECHNCGGCSGVRSLSTFSADGPATIARPDTVLDDAGIDCDHPDYPACANDGSGGPMGYEAHCESYIASTANWDLAQSLVEAHGSAAGWTTMERIWYGSFPTARSAYQVTEGGTCNPTAAVDGCGAGNWYTVYLALDDDDGNLANGTPNGCRIWDAFNAHGIACGARPACTGGSGGGGGHGAPLRPTDVTAIPVVGHFTEVRVTWRDNSNNEEGFRVYRLFPVPGEFPRLIATMPAGATSYLDETVEVPVSPNGTNFYYYTIRAFNGEGEGISEQAEARLHHESPGAPSNLNPRSCIQSLWPTLTWQGASNATSYYVRLLTADTHEEAMPDAVVAGTGSPLSFHLTRPLLAGRPYWLRVWAMNNVGWGDESGEQYFMAQCQPLAQPFPLEPRGCTDSLEPTLTWTPVPGALFYEVDVARVAVPDDQDLGMVGADTTSLKITPGLLSEPLQPRKEYRFWVRAHNGAVHGPMSSLRYFTPLCEQNMPPGTASPLTPAGVIDTATPTFYWEAARGASEYRLEVRTRPAGTLVAPPTVHLATVACGIQQCEATPPLVLAPGNYYFQLFPKNAYGEGPVSDAQDFTVTSLPSLSVSDVSVVEGTGGASIARFTLRLSAASGSAVSVHYATADGTALGDRDYTPVSGTATIAPPATTAEVAVTVLGDAVDEPDESFWLDLSAAHGAVLATGRARGTILDDDAAPQLVMGDAANPERGPASGGAWTVPVRLLGQSDREVTAMVAFGACTAEANSDFIPDEQVVTFAPGETEKVVELKVLDDSVPEGHEVIAVSLSDAQGASIAESVGQVTIVNDDVLGIRKRSRKRSDFDGDGNDDIVWQDPTTGALSLWRMVGVNRVDTLKFDPAAPVDANWKLVGVADFNGDTKPDLLWRNDTSGRLAFWLMDGVRRVSAFLEEGEADLSWKVLATGDFSGDASPDLLWRDDRTGELKVWFMNGLERQGEAPLTPSHPAADNWYVQGVGDFDGTGRRDDLLWRNATSGQMVVWLMDGVVRREARFLAPDSTIDGRVVALLDVDSDGTTDIVWQRDNPARLGAWLLRGTTLTCPTPLTPRVPDAPGRTVVGPR